MELFCNFIIFLFIIINNVEKIKTNEILYLKLIMYFINLFKGLRPTEENSSSVAITSTDHLSKDIDINKLFLKS